MLKKKILSTLLCVIVFQWLPSCSAMKEMCASHKTPKGFFTFNQNILIESENEAQFAGDIQKIFLAFIDSIEIKLNSKFKYMPIVYMCSTNKSFSKWTGAKFRGPRAKVTQKGLFISPRLKGCKDWSDIIYHELAHTLMFQYLGTYRYYTIPVWFHEGLATLVSNGGGTGDVTDSAAVDELLKGNHFYPYSGFIRSYLHNSHVAPWVEYRQYMLFVEYMKNSRQHEFHELLQSILAKKSFAKSYKVAYGKDEEVLWKLFIDGLKTKERM